MEAWAVDAATVCQLLGADLPACRSYLAERSADVPSDLLSRTLDLLAIGGVLGAIFLERQRAHDWVRRPNQKFDGRSALSVMVGEGRKSISRVRLYLEAELYAQAAGCRDDSMRWLRPADCRPPDLNVARWSPNPITDDGDDGTPSRKTSQAA